jgi:sugar phosphate isomerase/epimerase
MDRRVFIARSLAAATLALLPTRILAAMHQIKKVGLELYTVRSSMKTDFGGTIAKVASIGYQEVEFAGYFDHSPADVRAILEKAGLTAPSCHVGYDVVEKKWPETLEVARTIGHQFVVCPSIDEAQRKAPDGYKRAADLFNQAGEASKKAGIQFAYHNHTFEFQPDRNLGGKLPYDFLLTATDPNLVKMEMDLCWTIVAGQDPVAYFEHYPGRFPLVHVKDLAKLPHPAPDQVATVSLDEVEKDMTAIGSGVIDWKRIFAHADQAGIQHFFVENDKPKDAISELTASYNYLSQLRF